MDKDKEKNNFNIIKQAVIQALVFFDLFDYPLTAFELWKYCGVKCDLAYLEEVANFMRSSSGNGDLVFFANGFYFLSGREEIIKIRKRRYYCAQRKFKRAARIARIFKFIPWIKMIAVGNIIGAHNLKDESDIDFFIITEEKKIWLTRFFCNVITKLLGLRPKENNMKDKICLSFFISESAMDLKKLMLKGDKAEFQDVYFIYWLAELALVYDKNDTYKKFVKANSWLKEYLPNWPAEKIDLQHNAGQPFFKIYRDIVDLLFGGLEANLKKYQLKIMPEKIKQMANKDTRVIVSDQILKLHTNDRRKDYLEKFIFNLNRLSL